MNTIKLLLDPMPFHRKPKGNEIGSINNRIANTIKEISTPNELENLVRKIGSNGHTFCSATFKENRRSKETFEQQQLFVLDFDNKEPNKTISFEEAKARADYYELPILFAYDTLSSINHNKFRIVFLNDIPIPDRKIAEAMQLAIGTIFPEADSSCYKDVSRMYFGGKELLYYEETIPNINIDSVFRSLTHHWNIKDKSGKHFKEYMSRFSKKTGISLNKHGYLDITVSDDLSNEDHLIEEQTGVKDVVAKNGGISPNTIIYNIKGNGENPPFLHYKIKLLDNTSHFSIGNDSTRSITVNHKPYRSEAINEMSKYCKLYHEYETGKRRLHHQELLGLSNNMINVCTGEKTFLKILSKHPNYYADKINKWTFDLKYNINHDYLPEHCDKYCPYHTECKHGKNILTTVHLKQGKVEKLYRDNEVFHSLETVQEDTYNAINKAFLAEGTQFQIVKSQTSTGKSSSYLRIMAENPDKRFLISVSSNLLKDEIYNKAKNMGLNIMKTPSLEQIIYDIPINIRMQILYMYKCGKHNLVHSYIQSVLNSINISCLKEYMKEREKIKKFKGSIITTHHYLLKIGEKRLKEFNANIIDEDIIFKSIVTNQCEIPFSILKNHLNISDIHSPLYNKIHELFTLAEKQTYIKLKSFNWHNNKNEDIFDDFIKETFDIPSFCLATRFYVRKKEKEPSLKEDTVVFLRPAIFKNVKYIMVSATVNETICRKFFGSENVNFYKCKTAEYKGNLYQYAEKSMSRSSMRNDNNIVQNLMHKLGINEQCVITFKKENIGNVYFGNTEGINFLENKNILVVGTPHYPEFLYKLIAFSMGIDFNENEKITNQLVEYNGYRFNFMTFKNEHLREIQFWMIESELEQAIGRARLLRNKCNVHLFSNFPLKQAIMKS